MTGLAIGGKRLCGNGRILGGWYLECALSAHGQRPLDHFLVDYPMLLPASISVNPLGVTLWKDQEGVTHVVDHVGQQSYPFVPDFWEEARRMGFSRKIAPSLPLGTLSARSRFLFVHARGHVANAAQLMPFTEGVHTCPTGKTHPQTTPCAGLHWLITPGGKPGSRRRFLADGDYLLRGALHEGAPAVRYQPAIFASVPITGISHIAHASGVLGIHRTQMAAAQHSGLPVYAVPL